MGRERRRTRSRLSSSDGVRPAVPGLIPRRTALGYVIAIAVGGLLGAALAGWLFAAGLSRSVDALEEPVSDVFGSDLGDHDRRATEKLLQSAALWSGISEVAYNPPLRRDFLDGVIYFRLMLTIDAALSADDVAQLSEEICSAQGRFSADIELSLRLVRGTTNVRVVCTRPGLAEPVSALLRRALLVHGPSELNLEVDATEDAGVRGRVSIRPEDPGTAASIVEAWESLSLEPGVRELEVSTRAGSPP